LRILVITHPLPTPKEPNRMAPVARQIDSLKAIGVQVGVLQLAGVAKLKYLQSLPSLLAGARSVDLIHAHYGYCGWLARLQLSKPVVVSFMGSDLLGAPNANGRILPFSKLEVLLDCWLAYFVDAVIVKSAEMGKVVAPIEAHIVPNGVDLELFRPMDQFKARSLLGWTEDQHYILFPGNPDLPGKGFFLAQGAVHRASKQVVKPLALIPLKGVPHDHVPIYMNACDAMVLTSFTEGSPNVVKEAMACNLSVISVPVGDVPELLAGVPGYKICPRDAKELSEALVDTIANSRRVDGRTTLKRKGLDLESVARRLVKIYTDVLAQRKRARAHVEERPARFKRH
jgi:glycosyltransferase involved in cell wall biosynthesis